MYGFLFFSRYMWQIHQMEAFFIKIPDYVLQFPIDLEQYDRREQLKKSGLGKVRIHHLIAY